MGCRVFFCERGTQQWQNELYEAFLARLRALHDDLDLPYRYMEWRGGLEEAEAAGVGGLVSSRGDRNPALKSVTFR